MRKFNITVLNKYNLSVSDIPRLKVINEDKLSEPLFWRNNIINAWCISKSIGSNADKQYCTDNEIWLGIYDKPYYGHRVHFHVSAYGGMCKYSFDRFYDPSEIETEMDFKTHEECLRILNKLLDDKILAL